METINLTIDDLKVRDKIMDRLSSIQIISLYNDVRGNLKFNSSIFGFTGTLTQFDKILESIYKYNKSPNKWEFNINGIIVDFAID